MMPTTHARLTRAQIRKVLKRNHRSIARLAGQLGIRSQTVSCWLKGRTNSERISDAAHALAVELLSLEDNYHAS